MPPQAHEADQFTSFELSDPCDCLNRLNAIVIPRPIAFVTSSDATGIVNAAPFSYFNVVCTHPAIVSISIERRKGKRKDTANNILLRKEFVINICSQALAKVISIASGEFPSHISEVDLTKICLIPSEIVTIPRIANSPAQLECALFHHVEVGEEQCDLFLAKVLKLHVHKHCVDNGAINMEKLDPLARAGSLYGKVKDYFYIPRGI